MFTPIVIPNKHNVKAKSNEKQPRKKFGSDFRWVSNKKKIYFFSANTKYISSCAVKISAFSLVLRNHEKYWLSPHSMKYIWYSPKKIKYPLYIFTL